MFIFYLIKPKYTHYFLIIFQPIFEFNFMIAESYTEIPSIIVKLA